MNLIIKILPLITLTLNATFIDTVLERKKTPLLTFLVWVISTLTLFISFKIFIPSLLKNDITLIFIGVLYIFICNSLYKNNMIQIIFSFFSIWTVSSMVYSLFLYIVTLYFSFLEIQDQNLLRVFLYVLVYALFIFYCKKRILTTLKRSLALFDTKWTLFLIFPIISFSNFVLFRTYTNNKITHYTSWIALLNIFMVVFTYYLIFSMSKYILDKRNAEEELRVSMLHQSFQKEHYTKLGHSIAEISMIRHDLHHHLIYIQGLLNEEKHMEIDNYIRTLVSKESNIELKVLCDNTTVNSILSHYISLAEKSKIKVSTHLVIPETIHVDPQDINVILGNCLENAIEACLKLTNETERFIHMKSGIVHNNFVINIQNSFNGVMNIQNTSICSTKESSTLHGIGLNSVRNITNQYNGYMNVEYNQDVFTISIMLGLS